MGNGMIKHKGMLIFINADTRLVDSVEIDLPIETYVDCAFWGLDMLRKIVEFSRFRKWIIRILLGRYAYREMIGLRDSLVNKHGLFVEPGWYGIEGCEYHKDKVKPL